MDLFGRLKAILFSPKEEWQVIEAENPTQAETIRYLSILILITSALFFFSFWTTWHPYFSMISNSLLKTDYTRTATLVALGIVVLSTVLIIFFTILCNYLAAIIINALSDQFGASKDFNKVFSLLGYSSTPMCIVGILSLWTPLLFLSWLLGIYVIYLLYLGTKLLIKPDTGKQVGYVIMSIVVWMVSYGIILKVIMVILSEMNASMFNSAFGH